MKKRGLLCDLDGTLVDTREANFVSYRDSFVEHGFTLSLAEFESTWGRDSRDFIPDLLPTATVAQVQSIRDLKADIYAGNLHLTTLIEPVVAVLRASRADFHTALVTTAKAPSALSILEHHHLANLFDVIVTGDMLTRSKPDPEAYILAMAGLGLSADECLAVEDSESGVASAVAAGLSVLRVVHS